MTVHNVYQYIKDIDNLKDLILGHPICMGLHEDKFYFSVEYIDGLHIDGAKIKKGKNKSAALKKLLERMEEDYKANSLFTN